MMTLRILNACVFLFVHVLILVFIENTPGEVLAGGPASQLVTFIV